MLPHEKEHERAAFRQMTFSKKVQHLVTYYSLPAAIIAGSAIIVFILIWNIFVKQSDLHVFTAAVFDDYISEESKAPMYEDLKALFHVTDEHGIVRIDSGFKSTSMEDQLRISVMTTAEEYEVIVAGEEMFRQLTGSGYFLQLDEVLTKEELDALSEVLIEAPGLKQTESYSLNEDYSGKGEVRAYGISLKNCEKWKALGGTMEEPVAGIVISSDYTDNARLFIDYLFDLPLPDDGA